MKPITLADYVEEHGQSETARRAGVSQGAVWQMLKNDRRVFVLEVEDGRVNLEEHRAIPRRESV